MTARARLFALLALALLGGCKSVTVHLYTLSPAPAGAASEEASSLSGEFIIESVQIPRAVDRKELVIRRSDREMALLENDQWAASLRDEVLTTLTTQVRDALALQATARTNPATSSIVVEIREWEATSQAVIIDVSWQVRNASRTSYALVICERHLVERTTGTADDVVRADQALLQSLAQSMARALRAANPERCGT